MLILGPIGFVSPWLLLVLLGLPILWLILRAIPPAPLRRRFPGVALLLGLTDKKVQAARTPWWLILLRAVAVAAAVIGFSGPVLNPSPPPVGADDRPVLVLFDGGWADARDWPARLARLRAALADAGRAARPVAVLRLTDTPIAPEFQSAEVWASRVAGLSPAPWLPGDLAVWSGALPAGRYDSLWLSDGLEHRGRAELAAALATHGALRVVETDTPLLTLAPPAFDGADVVLRAARLVPGPGLLGPQAVDALALGPDPAGVLRELGRTRLRFDAGATMAEARLTLPPELRNRLTRFELDGAVAGAGHVGAIALTDDSVRRRKIGLFVPKSSSETADILTPAHFLRQALQPTADVVEGGLGDLLRASPDAIILPDGPTPPGPDGTALRDYVDKGGVLVRFAGPALAAGLGGQGGLAGDGGAAGDDDPLLPVRLRGGGLSMGGAMSWGEPKHLADFPETSPFHGLVVSQDVVVRQQMLAEPGPDLAARTLAALTDGTPLVTRRALGRGQVILFHVTANADWSNLPLSGLFPRMLDRLAVAARPAQPEAADLVGLTWQAEVTLDAFGRPQDAAELAGVDGAALAAAMAQGPGPAAPPGLYAARTAAAQAPVAPDGAARRVALNAGPQDGGVMAASWPPGTEIEGISLPRERPLGGWALALAVAALAADALATMALMGLVALPRRGAGVGCLVAGLVLAVPLTPHAVWADDSFALRATSGVVLAHVMTGDRAVDDMAQAGLAGLSQRLAERTAVEPDPPQGVDVEKDDLAFFPFLYWPLTADAPTPSAAAYAKLNDFLRTGGMILFDTRDGDMGGLGSGAGSGERAALRRIAGGLDIPPLSVIAPDHVLTRSFYLLQDFPGRFAATPVWAEAPNPSDAQAGSDSAARFSNQNDGVSPVIIGGNDWAAAWAVDDMGLPLVPVGRGAAGDRQREMATRFGINLIMYALTGNYKSDQVHVPALLDRLGQ